jgi:hypothetical protein
MQSSSSQAEAIKAKAKRAIEAYAEAIDEDNCRGIFTFREIKKGEIIWSVKICEVCNRPTLLHENPWENLSQQTCQVNTLICLMIIIV